MRLVMVLLLVLMLVLFTGQLCYAVIIRENKTVIVATVAGVTAGELIQGKGSFMLEVAVLATMSVPGYPDFWSGSQDQLELRLLTYDGEEPSLPTGSVILGLMEKVGDEGRTLWQLKEYRIIYRNKL